MTQPKQSHGADNTSPSQWSLEITRGQTDFPVRPIDQERFLIGAGSSCDLQLGGGEIPILHSIAEFDGTGLHIEALVAAPELIIDGKTCRSGQLTQGGILTIGPFEFIAHCAQTKTSGGDETATLAAVEPVLETAGDSAEQLREAVASMSAAELLEQIERDCEMIDDFDRSRADNVDWLLQAAEAAPAELTHTEPTHELPETVAEELSKLAEQLESRTAQLADREAKIAQRAATLTQAQQELLAQLDRLSDQLQLRTLESDSDEDDERAIA